jgi:Ca2+-binding RTX toxin-like protein
MKGDGVEWHLYGLDDCVLTEVEASPPRLSDPRVRIDGSFSFLIQGDPGTTNLVQASTNLVDWRTLTQMVVTNTVPPEALDAQAGSLPHGFYRVMIPAP